VPDAEADEDRPQQHRHGDVDRGDGHHGRHVRPEPERHRGQVVPHRGGGDEVLVVRAQEVRGDAVALEHGAAAAQQDPVVEREPPTGARDHDRHGDREHRPGEPAIHPRRPPHHGLNVPKADEVDLRRIPDRGAGRDRSAGRQRRHRRPWGIHMGKSLVALVVVVALLGACSSGDDDTAADGTTTTAAGASQGDVDAALLVAADLASDDPLDGVWLVGDVAEGVDIVLPECIDEELLDPAPADGAAKFVTQSDLKLPSLEQHIGGYSGDGAAAAFDAAVARLDGCEPEFTFQGTPSSGVIERLELPALGDESAAWHTTVTIAGTSVDITSFHVRDGDLEMSLVYTFVGTPDTAVIADLFTRAAAKLS
jgi:hypothetical protein